MSMDLMEWIENILVLVVSSDNHQMMSAAPLLKDQILLDGVLVYKLRSVVDSAEFVLPALCCVLLGCPCEAYRCRLPVLVYLL